MNVGRLRLFWKIYLTLLASLFATTVVMGTLFWFVGESQHEDPAQTAYGDRVAKPWPGDVSLYEADGRLIGLRGRPIAITDRTAVHNWSLRRVLRIDLPDGRFVLTRLGPPGRTRAVGILVIMLVVAGGVGLAAYPVTALLTRRLEALRAGVERWGERSPVRLDDRGNDEVALLASTFNTAAARLDTMLASQKALLANASHELRSPLARLRVAIEVGPRNGVAAHDEIVQNLAEIDQLVDELLLSSRLDHPGAHADRREPVDVLGLVAEEGAPYDAVVTGDPIEIVGDPILLRRMIRNLLENSAKHGRAPVTVTVSRRDGGTEIVVRDAGKGIAAAERDRIFEPFYRPAGSREASGGWGLGLALVRQIAEHHGGTAACRAEPFGGSSFVVKLQGS